MDAAEEARRRVFARVIDEIRLSQGDRPGKRMTTVDFGKLLGVSQQTVSKWAGKDGLSGVDPDQMAADKLEAIARLYGCGLNEFIAILEDRPFVEDGDRFQSLLDEVSALSVEQLAQVMVRVSRLLADRLKPGQTAPTPQPSTPVERIAYLLKKDMQRRGIPFAEYAAKIELSESDLATLLKGNLPNMDREALFCKLVSIEVAIEDGGIGDRLPLHLWEELLGIESPKHHPKTSTLLVRTTRTTLPP